MAAKTSPCWRSIASVTALLAVVACAPVQAQNNGKNQDFVGKYKYAQLTALWWQWVLAQPAINVGDTNTNPVLDTTGDFATVGQENGIGPGDRYFFLAGTFGGDVVRTVTVPHGKSLFFPVINTDVDNATEPPTNYTVPQLVALAKANIDVTTSTYATLDGAPLEIFRTASPTFAYTMPDEYSLYDYFGLFGPQFEGTIQPAVSDGYWVVLPPLRPGKYTLNFGAANPSGFTGDITYHLTIE